MFGAMTVPSTSWDKNVALQLDLHTFFELLGQMQREFYHDRLSIKIVCLFIVIHEDNTHAFSVTEVRLHGVDIRL